MQATPMLPEAAVGIAVADHKMPWMAFSSVTGKYLKRVVKRNRIDASLHDFSGSFKQKCSQLAAFCYLLR
ncbi:hypothetical protein [Oceanimonas smirnovii]|uniref:hypothetical protein n=1 Tax=Oceanimonas smirnovii TaxID=264574 RepID=UPI003FD05010